MKENCLPSVWKELEVLSDGVEQLKGKQKNC